MMMLVILIIVIMLTQLHLEPTPHDVILEGIISLCLFSDAGKQHTIARFGNLDNCVRKNLRLEKGPRVTN